jgi:predicted GNAT superfamily acetyltransferase
LLYILHIFSCIWFFISYHSGGYNWIVSKGIENATWEIQYLEAFYYATITMLTIGYGDSVPISNYFLINSSWSRENFRDFFYVGCLHLAELLRKYRGLYRHWYETIEGWSLNENKGFEQVYVEKTYNLRLVVQVSLNSY